MEWRCCLLLGAWCRRLSVTCVMTACCACACMCAAGEINTLQGNLNWIVSREHELHHPVWNGELQKGNGERGGMRGSTSLHLRVSLHALLCLG